MGLVRVYLCVYNWLLFAGWLQILVSAVKALQQSGPSGVYAAVEKPLQIWQTAALFEIFNSIVGIVRSPVMATLPQIGSRIYLTWGILFSFPQVQEHWLVTSLVLSWSITEVIRYSFFGLKETFGYTPRFLLWLREPWYVYAYDPSTKESIGCKAQKFMRSQCCETGSPALKAASSGMALDLNLEVSAQRIGSFLQVLHIALSFALVKHNSGTPDFSRSQSMFYGPINFLKGCDKEEILTCKSDNAKESDSMIICNACQEFGLLKEVTVAIQT